MITLLTPTYNRASLLQRLYQSLIKQNCQDFEWLIVDDGSVDDTEYLIESFRRTQQNGVTFPIQYIKKSNGGKHTAINLGVQHAQGELILIVDSDDLLPVNAILTVLSQYNKVKGDDAFAGVAGLDFDMNNRIIGTGLPQSIIHCNAMEIRYRFKVQGDLKEAFKKDVLLKFPFPEIEGERFCPEQLVWFRIAQHYKLRYFNQPIYLADYQDGGITSNIVRARMNSPIASMLCYGELTTYQIPFKEKIKAAINYYRFKACLTRDSEKSNQQKLPSISCKWYWVKPLGILMHLSDKRKS